MAVETVRIRTSISTEANDILEQMVSDSGLSRDEVLDIIVKSSAVLSKPAIVTALKEKAEVEYQDRLKRIEALDPRSKS